MALALLCAILLSGCAALGEEDGMYARLRRGEVLEAYDMQAVPALEAGLAGYWYPQHPVTAVVAVDRERTDAVIAGWRDLLSAGVDVGFDGTAGNSEMLMAAMAYGLEGEGFTLRGAADLLAELRARGLLAFGACDTPVVVCFAPRAAALGLEIILPEEGTLTYVKGLLSNRPLEVPHDAGLQATFTDYGYLNTVFRDVTRVLRRSVLRTRLYSSADSREHQLSALLFMVLATIWVATMIRRAMQKGVRRASLLIGVLLLGWIAVRLLKYQMPGGGALNRYFWYSFYLFMLALPPALLWLAWTIDQPEHRVRPPKWFALPAAAGGALAALVFTNDLHNWAFRLDLSNPNWASEYGYGPVHMAVVAYCALVVLAAMVMMIRKGRRSPRKGGVVFPFAFYVLLLAYSLAYAMRSPLAWDSDATMVAGLFTLLFMESFIRAGMIPVNSKYRLLFTNSPLAMQIMDSADNLVLSSVSAPLRRDGDTLLLTAPIAGGRVLWQEDISALNRLHREAEEQTRRLESANAILAEEERIKRTVEEERARAQILSQLEVEIAGYTERLSGMIERREGAARIALLVCYIKRRCNLFFRDRETPHREEGHSLPAEELSVYMDELAEFAGYAGLRIVLASQLQAPAGQCGAIVSRSEIVLRSAALLYGFFYGTVDWALPGDEAREGGHMLASLCREEGMLVMRLQYACARPFQIEESLSEAVAAAGGAVEVKDLGDAVGINLSLPDSPCRCAATPSAQGDSTYESPPLQRGEGRRPGGIHG